MLDLCKETFVIIEAVFLQAGCPSCDLGSSDKSLKELRP